MKQIELGDTVTLPDGTFDLVSRSGSMVQLRNTLTGETTGLTLVELGRLLPEPEPQLPSKRDDAHLLPLEPRVLESLSRSQTAQVEFWSAHIHELLHGAHPTLKRTLACYDVSNDLEDRIRAKSDELIALGIRGGSRASLFRKMGAYEQSGPLGLVDERWLRTYQPYSRVSDEVLEALESVRAELSSKSTRTASAVIDKTRAKVLKKHGRDMPPMPATSSFYRYLNMQKHDYLTSNAKAHRTNANRPNRQLAKNTERTPGAQVQIDSTPWDILILGPDGKQYRPILTIMWDVASRSILSFHLRIKAAKGVDHAFLLALALTPRDFMSKGLQEAREVISRRLPPDLHLASWEELAKPENARPFAYPSCIVTDNGKDFVSTTFISAAATHGIDIRWSAPHTPTDKAGVERMFRSINTLFLQNLPGYTGRSPLHRGQNVEGENLIHLDSLQQLFDDWVLTQWQNRPHKGLIEDALMVKPLTPNQVLRRSAELTSTLRIPFTENDFIELLPSAYRKIQPVGIQLENRVYDSPDLQHLRQARSPLANKGGKWEVKYNPNNPWQVWVRTVDGFVECVIRTHSMVDEPLADIQFTPREMVALTSDAMSGIVQPRFTRVIEATGEVIDWDDVEPLDDTLGWED